MNFAKIKYIYKSVSHFPSFSKKRKKIHILRKSHKDLRLKSVTLQLLRQKQSIGCLYMKSTKSSCMLFDRASTSSRCHSQWCLVRF